MPNVRFYFGTQQKFDALVEKNPIALYFIEDTQRLYKGNVLIATGAEATALSSGLMSAEDKIKLDSLVVGGVIDIAPIDKTIVIGEDESGNKTIGVAVSAQNGNAISVVDDGLFVPAAKEVLVPEYEIEKQAFAEEGYLASYKLKRTLNGESSYVGDTINVAKDKVLQSASMKIVEADGIPYDGAVVGDPYIEMIFNDESASALHIPMNGLVDVYTAGDGIEIVGGNISAKIAEESNGLEIVDGALSIALATSESAGALSAADKVFIDSIPDVYSSMVEEAKSYTDEQIEAKIVEMSAIKVVEF